jgi:formylglycine-generating enzyme required for sulfatase activity
VNSGDLPRVALALAQQLSGTGSKHSTPAPARSYPAELDIEMVFVEGGTFEMGCNGTTDAPCHSDNRETPQRMVTVSNFSIGKYEITRAQWKAVMSGHSLENPSSFTYDDQLPIERVSWMDIDTAFLPRLNALTGRTTEATKYRLPTEAEWEYAARGCKAGVCDKYKFIGGEDYLEVTWGASNSNSSTHPVGQKKPNDLGIYDMAGNVWELCWDCWDINYYKNRLTTGNNVNPKYDCGVVVGSVRTIRGGDWRYGGSAWSRPTGRSDAPVSTRSNNVGFRVALPAQ